LPSSSYGGEGHDDNGDHSPSRQQAAESEEQFRHSSLERPRQSM
jgi:hypothetical protein